MVRGKVMFTLGSPLRVPLNNIISSPPMLTLSAAAKEEYSQPKSHTCRNAAVIHAHTTIKNLDPLTLPRQFFGTRTDLSTAREAEEERKLQKDKKAELQHLEPLGLFWWA
jgi:hypothetical protein